MASALYPKAKEAFLSGGINLSSDTIKVALVSNAGSYNAADQYKSSVASYSGTTDQTLGSKSVTDGVFNAGTATFSSVALSGGATVAALVIYKDVGGVAANSPVIAWIDGFTAVTPNGGNITITWDTGTNKIFKL